MPPDKIDILPNGTDFSKFKPSSVEERMGSRRKLGLDEKGYCCLLVANFVEVKDIPTLLQGARIVRTLLPNCQFILVGDGDQRAQLEKQAACLEVNGSVRFFGRQADVRPFLAAADVGVLTSRSEGSSNAVIEYMAAGLPTILSDIEPNQELTEGVFFRQGDPKDFATKIAMLARDQELSNRLSIANQEMAQEFGLTRFVERAQAYYGKLASETE
jgi:glycosyltransferase involved in cell wall biosynthesis